jgi:hypothetical protein
MILDSTKAAMCLHTTGQTVWEIVTPKSILESHCWRFQMSTRIAKVDLNTLERDFAQLERQGVAYGLGAKAEGSFYEGVRWNPHSTGQLSTPLTTVKHLDCSGFVRYALYRATEGKLIIPDGSQVQREWCERQAAAKLLHKASKYENTNKYLTKERLFIAFIKPWTNGCGAIGHVWLIGQFDKDISAETIESYGGPGVGSRPWNARKLLREVYSVYELPAKR